METHALDRLSQLTIGETATLLRTGTPTSAGLVDASLRTIEALNPQLHAFIDVDAEGARAAAQQADAERRAGQIRGPLHGIPISLKDLVDVAGKRTTAASKVLADSIARADAPVVTRLREAGAIFLGKTNLHEFALGTTSEDTAFGVVKNPRDQTRSAGGSSGGSAVAVATGMGLASIGSDTGGSIRIPASCCGIVGLKPSIADVPTAGVIPLSSSLDHVGPLAKCVQDAAWLWAILAARPVATVAAADPTSLRFRRVGGYFDLMTPEVRAAFEAAIAAITAAGATVAPVEIDATAGITKTYVDIVLPEGAAWHAPHLDSRPELYTPPVRARLESGRAIPAVDYLTARKNQARLRAAVDAALEGAEALLLPTLPITAPLLGAENVSFGPPPADTLPVRAVMLRNTQLFNLSGHPAISLPLPVDLPVGLQVVGRLDQTPRLLEIAAACEKILR